MIIDQISNARNYIGSVKNLENALQYLANKERLPEGRYVFEGGFILSVAGKTTPRDSKDFEAHRKYADVMFVLEGKEEVSFCAISALETVKEYSEADDCSLHTGGGDCVLEVLAGMFYVMLPNEGHKPCIYTKQPSAYRKYIIKCEQE